MIVILTLAHYTLNHSFIYLHDLSRRLYYLPIILSALWFGRRGGTLAALAVSAFFLPHGMFMWYGENMRFVDNLIEIALFNIVGFMIGDYIEKKNQQRLQAEESARQLKEAYDQLEENTGKIIQLEKELRFADRLFVLGELSASLAHEVRNPLGGIQGAAEIFRAKIPADAPERRFVQIQLDEIQRLNRVVENYLALAKHDASDFQPTDLIGIIRNTLDLLRISAKRKQINLTVEYNHYSKVIINCNSTQIQQALLNLVLNAIQALSENGEVRISLTFPPDNHEALITITDNGPGIPSDIGEKIFESFFTTKEKGTGLGLSIVRRIIHEHNGKIWYTSDAQGTNFYIKLPVESIIKDIKTN